MQTNLRREWSTILKSAPAPIKQQYFTISRHASPHGGCLFHAALRFFGFALVFERLDDVTSSIVDANHDGMRPTV